MGTIVICPYGVKRRMEATLKKAVGGVSRRRFRAIFDVQSASGDASDSRNMPPLSCGDPPVVVSLLNCGSLVGGRCKTCLDAIV